MLKDNFSFSSSLKKRKTPSSMDLLRLSRSFRSLNMKNTTSSKNLNPTSTKSIKCSPFSFQSSVRFASSSTKSQAKVAASLRGQNLRQLRRIENTEESKAPKDSTDLLAQSIEQIEAKQAAEEVEKTKKKGAKRGWTMRVRQPDEAWAILKGIHSSVWKINIVAHLMRKRTYADALAQLQLCSKKIARPLMRTLKSARANAENNYNLDRDRLIVSEVWVSKQFVLKRMLPHGRGRAGEMRRDYSRVTVILKEMPEEYFEQLKEKNKPKFFSNEQKEQAQTAAQ
eukprot:TRINITY_DN2527_c0_g1_i1.p1 TRINITY_DN2527_c0_g1~~TRINITY_DN2527_c0_g1_i1.p1  ORF type:complete len:283 (+),score=85.40 TRINITY_DN2527_c0_g1_i1:369-1217(+)